MTDWTIRAYNAATDETFIAHAWHKSLCHSRAGRIRGANVPRTDAELTFWRENRPWVNWCLENTDVVVAVDESDPDVLLGFGSFTDHACHYVLVKRSVRGAHLAPDLMRDIIGNRLEKPIGYTFEPVEFRRWPSFPDAPHLPLPERWYPDFTWAQRHTMTEGVAMHSSVVQRQIA